MFILFKYYTTNNNDREFFEMFVKTQRKHEEVENVVPCNIVGFKLIKEFK